MAAGQTRRMQLRNATRTAHQALDDFIGPWPDLAHYRFYLAGQRRFRAAIDAVNPAATGLAWSFEPLGEALAADCADLGLADAGTTGSPGGVGLLQPHGRSEALGLCYVVEGAALGAKLLHARAAELGLHEGFAARHLAIQARSMRWRSFLTLLEAEDGFDLDLAVAAATGAFAFAAGAFKAGHVSNHV